MSEITSHLLENHLSTHSGTRTTSRSDLRAKHVRIKLWPDLALVTAFWIYVALANVLWGASMEASLAKIGIEHVFAPWNTRLLQHLLLYPALVGTLWMSRRTGWQPTWRAIPLQILFALGFSFLANPAMDLAEGLTGISPWRPLGNFALWPMSQDNPGIQGFSWLASATNFILPDLVCLAVLAGLDIYRRYRDAQIHSAALQRSLSVAHLAALRMQLSPHTLFNLLHTIRGQVAWNPPLAQAMIVQLGDLLRRLLRAGENDLSRLQDELELVRLYLDLQQTRFVDRLTTVTPSPDAIPPIWVPSLILQPLVENAVVHGLADSQSIIDIRIEVLTIEETLVLRVVNSCTPREGIAQPEHSGIGLRNTRERLAVQFGEQASLRAGPNSDTQWVAEIRLPILHNSV